MTNAANLLQVWKKAGNPTFYFDHLNTDALSMASAKAGHMFINDTDVAFGNYKVS